MAGWHCAYLVHGDDHGRIAERRASLRAKAEAESGVGGLELLEGDASSPEAAAAALNAMTFATGRRFIVVDGVQEWKDKDVTAHLVPALKDPPPETTIAFFGREDGRKKVPAALEKAVKAAGGVVGHEQQRKAKDLPRWAIGEAQRLGIELESSAAQALVAQVGDRQQRLLRELEKLALEHGPGARLGAEEVEAVAAPSAERQVWGFVDALVARNHPAALRAFLDLREQGEALPRLIPLMARRIREVLQIALRLEAGESPAQVKASMKGSPWMVDRRIKEARASDADALRTALEALAALELDTRGQSALDEETSAVRVIARIAA
ncbi:DNA polymerase III subunit delta [Conexibacter sp. SYSU D00693]|uniref:DNA polymerase III subunit delta n=1 Tax=Conexibacter sp. SYSU D00693 TaxID=2812560 RepID=UPI00196A556C|nr:DNA polymerase III subunit delta [Conexibacter sp. SYSU D00693]